MPAAPADRRPPVRRRLRWSRPFDKSRSVDQRCAAGRGRPARAWPDCGTVRVHASGVKPVDWKSRAGPGFLGTPPFTVGWDVSGVVEAVAVEVNRFVPADEVFGLALAGGRRCVAHCKDDACGGQHRLPAGRVAAAKVAGTVARVLLIWGAVARGLARLT